MLLKDLPEKLQDFAILRMVEQGRSFKLRATDQVARLFVFSLTDEWDEWIKINLYNDLEPMYTKYPELR